MSWGRERGFDGMEPDRGRSSRQIRTRGQTAIDFMVGMGVFLLAIGFVFGFAPSLFEPFTTGSGGSLLIASRGSTALAEDLLVESPTQPTILDETCTVEFFDNDGATGSCRFGTEDLHGALGVNDVRSLNVTIEAGGSVATLTAGGDTATLSRGPKPDSFGSVVVSKRLVRLGGEEMTLFVRVW